VIVADVYLHVHCAVAGKRIVLSMEFSMDLPVLLRSAADADISLMFCCALLAVLFYRTHFVVTHNYNINII